MQMVQNNGQRFQLVLSSEGVLHALKYMSTLFSFGWAPDLRTSCFQVLHCTWFAKGPRHRPLRKVPTYGYTQLSDAKTCSRGFSLYGLSYCGVGLCGLARRCLELRVWRLIGISHEIFWFRIEGPLKHAIVLDKVSLVHYGHLGRRSYDGVKYSRLRLKLISGLAGNEGMKENLATTLWFRGGFGFRIRI